MDLRNFSATEIDGMTKPFRRNLINSLSGYKSANLVGTQSDEGQTNLAIFSSIHHIGANPPLLGMIVRPATVPRHSYENILKNSYYTINHISRDIFQQSHQTSARYERAQSEFDGSGLTKWYSGNIPVPYVEEAPVKIGMKLEEIHKIRANQTVMVVGRIMETILPDRAIRPDGTVELEKLGVVAVSGLDTYHLPQKLASMPYAKP